jgi:hypothetical protein
MKFSVVQKFMPYNGPAVELVGVAERLEAVTTKAPLLRAGSRYTAERSEAWRGFCKSRYKFYRSRACRGTSLIEAGKLSRYRMFVRGTCAVSRYKFDRSQKPVTVQEFYCVQMRASGCKFW